MPSIERPETDKGKPTQSADQQTLIQDRDDLWLPAICFILSQGMLLSFSVTLCLIIHYCNHGTAAIDGASLMSEAAVLILHIDAAIILLPQCPLILQLLRQRLPNRMVDVSSWMTLAAVSDFIVGSLVISACVHALFCYVLIAKDSMVRQRGFDGFLITIFLTGVGWTGYAMLLLMAGLVVLLFSKHGVADLLTFTIRRKLCLLLGILAVLHGCFIGPGLQVHQQRMGGLTWHFAALGALMYLTEMVLGFLQCFRPSSIARIIQHPSDVVEIQIKPKVVMSEIGQSIAVCFPELSIVDFFSFIVTSAPEENYLSIHLDCSHEINRKMACSIGCDFATSQTDAGSYMALKDDVEAYTEAKKPSAPSLSPQLVIKGPYGNATRNIVKSNIAVCIGAGSRAVAFASVLKSVWYHMNSPYGSNSLKRVYFIWICRDFVSYEWFKSLLLAIEMQDLDWSIEIHTYFTGSIEDKFVAASLSGSLTSLREKIKSGRPGWRQLFTSLRQIHAASNIDVFHAGPRLLAKELQIMCRSYSDLDTQFSWKGSRF